VRLSKKTHMPMSVSRPMPQSRGPFEEGLAAAVARDPGLAAKIAANPARYAEDVDLREDIVVAADEDTDTGPLSEADSDSDTDDEDLFMRAPLTQQRSQASPVRSPSRRGPDAEREDQAADPFVLVQPAPSIGSGWAFDFFPYSSQPYSQPAEDASLDTIIMQRDVSLDLQALILADEDAADSPSEFETSPLQLQCDWGRSDPSWICFNTDFPSAARYEGNVVDLLFFHELQEDCEEKTLCKSMIAYFQELHDAGYAPTTLRSKFSCIKKFYLHTGRGDLSLDCPIIESNLHKWDKTHTIKQARVFKKEDFGKYCTAYTLHNTQLISPSVELCCKTNRVFEERVSFKIQELNRGLALR
jgi:hypothetical protein